MGLEITKPMGGEAVSVEAVMLAPVVVPSAMPSYPVSQNLLDLRNRMLAPSVKVLSFRPYSVIRPTARNI